MKANKAVWLNLVVFGLKALGVFRYVERKLRDREVRAHERTRGELRDALAKVEALEVQCRRLRASRNALLTRSSNPDRVYFD